MQRVMVPEIMDGPGLAEAEHLRALAGLRRINLASNTAENMVGPILQLAMREKFQKISMLDIACGGGDVPIAMALLAKGSKIEVDLTLMDRSATALAQAHRAAGEAGISCKCIEADLAAWEPTETYDVVSCSLFLHHLQSPGAVVELLGKMRRAARRLVVISDLRRGWAGWLAAWIGTRILSRSPIVHFDGPVSVRAAWTMSELREFAKQARLSDARVKRAFPCRMLLTWERGRDE